MKNIKYLLLLFVFVNCNSKNSENDKIKSIVKNERVIIKNDSLEITINNIPPETTTGFIYVNENLVNSYVHFENKSKIHQKITKKIPKINSNDFIIMFRSLVVIHNKSNIYKHDYYIYNNVNSINFDFKNGNLLLNDKNDKVIILDDVYEKYVKNFRKTYKAINISNQVKIKNLENLYEENKKNYFSTNNKTKLVVNELEFLNRLSAIKGNDKRVVQYLKKIQNPIWSTTLAGLFYHNIESTKDSIYKIVLNDINFSVSYKQILPVMICWHLQQKKDKQYPSYVKNLEWFKKTTYYLENKNEIDLNLLPTLRNSDLLSSQLKQFLVNDINKKNYTLSEIVRQNEFQYYLIDFWASWCMPCLQDSKLIHKMTLPKNLKLINISLDKTKDYDKWVNKSKQLNIEDCFLFVENKTNRDFINLVDLSQIPRYILIDKNFKILELNMSSPSEGGFENELKNHIAY